MHLEGQARVIRGVLMNPEHELFVPTLHQEVLRTAARAVSG